jgi:hypothetical protein
MPILAAIAAIAVALYLWALDNAKGEGKRYALPVNPRGPFLNGDRIIIIGLPMSGKTTLAAKLTKDVPRILFFDPFHDYRTIAKAPEILADALIENPRMLDKPEFRYSIIPDEDDLGGQLESVVAIARAAGDMVFVMDEVGDYKQEATKTMEKLARNGRHNGIVPFYVSQVAMDIPRTVRRLASQVYSFRQEDPDDLDALSERYGDAFAIKVRNLPQHRYAKWTLQGFGRTPATKRQGSQEYQQDPISKNGPSS